MPETDGNGKSISELKAEVKSKRTTSKKDEVKSIHEKLPDNLKSLVDQACDKGASGWLNALPIKEQNLDLNKEEFRDALRLRYNAALKNLPTYCACGERFNECHAMNCKKGGFVVNRHDNIRDFFGSVFKESLQ